MPTSRSSPRAERPARRMTVRDVTADVVLVLVVTTVLFGAVVVAREWSAPLDTAPPIDLDPRSLPLYASYSLARGLVAFLLSLVFAVSVGKLAASSRNAERVVMPVLDVLQSIPVLSFLPGLVLGLVGLFPSSNLGIELACVLAIFTGQVWNLVFSFHASVLSVPGEMREAAATFGFGRLRTLFALELPCAIRGLVWNSMVSMAGGWFFLTVCESFVLSGHEYRLPGIGSYLSMAVRVGDLRAAGFAAATMVVMVVAIDQMLWRPLLVWAERFRLGESVETTPPRSWMHTLVTRSPLGQWLRRRPWNGPGGVRSIARRRPPTSTGSKPVASARNASLGVLVPAVATAGVVLAGIGTASLVTLLVQLGATAWWEILRSLLATALRVLAALLLGLAVAVPLGLVLAKSRPGARFGLPLVQVVASFPAPMLYPFVVPLLLLLGVPADLVAILLMTLGTVWYLVFNVAAGVASVPHDLVEAATVFGLSRWRRLLVVDLAAALPALVTGLITAAGGAWNASIVAELVESADRRLEVRGIGSFIARTFRVGDTARLAAATVLVAVVLVLVNRLGWKPLQRRVAIRFSWNR